MSHIAVIDIGKTNAKLALVHRETLEEVAVVTRPNKVIDAAPWPHFDVDGHWHFLLEALAAFHASHGVSVITATTHGACAALLDANGALAAPVMDYEHDGPADTAAAYDELRPPFAETGSARLPGGLNLGAQLHWLFTTDPELHARTNAIVTYPQYWGFRLTGQLACDKSSLGCHTDLWNPFISQPSSLVQSLGIADKLAPARNSADVLGTLRPDIAARTGLAPETPVLCGIHDSNASLLPHILRQDPPFSVVSTGTWVIVMTVGGEQPVLDPARDALMNVSALGEPVPSARFMGGREYEMVLGGQSAPCDKTDILRIAETGPMLMPAVVPESGPFQGRSSHWIGGEPPANSVERTVSTGFYLALMTAECLSLTSHEGPVIVEGPFAANASYCAMLAVATGSIVEITGGITGTSQGAAMLADGAKARAAGQAARRVLPEDFAALSNYAARWRKRLGTPDPATRR